MLYLYFQDCRNFFDYNKKYNFPYNIEINIKTSDGITYAPTRSCELLVLREDTFLLSD